MDTTDVELVSVAAVGENGAVGRDGELPWPSIPADRRQYRERVADDPAILGRRTFESMLENLPGAAQIVLSRSDRDYDVDTAFHASGVEEAVETAASLGADRAYVLGGGGIYELFQPVVDRMLLSRVHGEYDGDVYFPEWDRDDWELLKEEEHDRFTLREWIRAEGAT